MIISEAWESAAYNYFWYAAIGFYSISFVIGLAILLFVKNIRLSWTMFFIISLFLCYIGTEFYIQSVVEKWELRYGMAITIDEKRMICDRDTGNISFAPIIGMAYAVSSIMASLSLAIIIKALTRELANQSLKGRM